MTHLSCLDFLERERFVHVPDPVTGRLGPMRLYREQRAFIAAVVDARDATGGRPIRRAVFSVPKKGGKTGLAAAIGLYMTLFDPFDAWREVYSIAWDLDQARLPWQAAEQMVKRSPAFQPWLRTGTLKIFRDVIVLEDREGGGTFRCLSHDTKGLHGISPSCLLVDETWNQENYDLLEAVTLPPTRRSPLELHFTYAGLKAQQVAGNPLWDLYQAGLAGTDPRLHVAWYAGRAANRLVPWITDQYLRDQEAALPTNRFRRLHCNEWGAADTAFLVDTEIARALDGSVDRTATDRVHPWVAAIDYGRTVDMTAICVARLRPDGVVQVGDLVVLKGTREQPVPLELVEQEILALARRFRLVHVLADQWQMHGSIERLARRGVRIRPVTFGPAYLNQITTTFLTLMRSGRFKCFVHPDFEAQLQSVICRETFFGVRIDSGTGAGVRGHDDLVIAAAMAAALAIEKGRDVPILAWIGAPTREETPALRILREARAAREAAGLARLAEIEALRTEETHGPTT
jgi:phage terminase large subunit-like protein